MNKKRIVIVFNISIKIINKPLSVFYLKQIIFFFLKKKKFKSQKSDFEKSENQSKKKKKKLTLFSK